ncbi:related to Pre-60S factor REI1 [Hanseniaspora guilliermondii]|uniref:Related to Pre-60S factor REI1 n=1 Tax=Hanseniaspora guilliermondii TaxID=56406 RepID=A0A1L0B692_9ASCO|nr:related to Pre-60S factor REI1 [Hanseniaspora guilliermondii]
MNYTCNACWIQFTSTKDQRSHMQTEWHRYNLKRKVAELPAIDEKTFNDKVSKINDQRKEVNNFGINMNEKDSKLSPKDLKKLQKQELLKKKQDLLELAKKQIELKLKRIQDDGSLTLSPEVEKSLNDKIQQLSSDIEKIQFKNRPKEPLSEEEIYKKKLANQKEFKETDCLFCPLGSNKKITTYEENIDHMKLEHGFTFPEEQYLVNPKGLLKYLSEKIGLGNMCLSCNFEGKSTESCQQHMIMKQHCKIPYFTDDEKFEISEFYDFTEYNKNRSFNKKYGSESIAEEDEWDDVEDDTGDEGETQLVVTRRVDKNGNYIYEDDEGIDYTDAIFNSGDKLYLPNGLVLGNKKDLQVYSKHVKKERTVTEGQGTVLAAESRHFITLVDKKEFAEKKRTWQKQTSDAKRDEKRYAKNANNQMFYRDQLLQ